jgi:hypothetical protein
MKRSCLVLLVFLLLAPVSFAQQDAADQPASAEDIQRYLNVMHTTDMIKSTVETMQKTMRQIVHDQLAKTTNLPPDAEARLNKMVGDMYSDFPTDKFMQAIVPVYQKHFTKSEIEALIAFYSSPAGQKMIKEMPGLMADTMKASTGILQDMMAKATQRVQDEIAELQKENNKDSKPGTQPSSN